MLRFFFILIIAYHGLIGKFVGDDGRAFPFSARFAPMALTKGLVVLFLQASQASMQGKGSMGKPWG